MSDRSDWISITLSEDEMQVTAQAGRAWRERAVAAGARNYSGASSMQGHILGVRGELAYAKYLGTGYNCDDRWADDIRRGYDVAGVQVRTRSNSRYGLPLYDGDRGVFVLVWGHECPRMWLVGQIDASSGFRIGRWIQPYDNRFCVVDAVHLSPLPSPASRQPDDRGHHAEPDRCRILANGRRGCGCRTCRRELAEQLA